MNKCGLVSEWSDGEDRQARITHTYAVGAGGGGEMDLMDLYDR